MAQRKKFSAEDPLAPAEGVEAPAPIEAQPVFVEREERPGHLRGALRRLDREKNCLLLGPVGHRVVQKPQGDLVLLPRDGCQEAPHDVLVLEEVADLSEALLLPRVHRPLVEEEAPYARHLLLQGRRSLPLLSGGRRRRPLAREPLPLRQRTRPRLAVVFGRHPLRKRGASICWRPWGPPESTLSPSA